MSKWETLINYNSDNSRVIKSGGIVKILDLSNHEWTFQTFADAVPFGGNTILVHVFYVWWDGNYDWNIWISIANE